MPLEVSPSATPSAITDGLGVALGSIKNEVWAIVSSSPIIFALCLLVAGMVFTTIYRTIRWAPLAFAGKDPERRFSTADRTRLLSRAGNRCEHRVLWSGRCRATTNLHADHVHPHSKGGSSHISNGQVLCSRHNKEKNARIPYNWELRRLAKNRVSYFPQGVSIQVVRKPRRKTCQCASPQSPTFLQHPIDPCD